MPVCHKMSAPDIPHRRVASRFLRWLVLTSAWSTNTAGQAVQRQALTSIQACREFVRVEGGDETSATSFWSESECIEVWKSWARTLPGTLYRLYPDRNLLREPAEEMRLRGKPCLVESVVSADGVGSSTLRHLAAWIFAEEVGCDWLTPDWGIPKIGQHGSMIYCHTVATPQEVEDMKQKIATSNASVQELQAMLHRCSLTNWLEFFNLAEASVEPPQGDSIKAIEANVFSSQDLKSTLEDHGKQGVNILEWKRLKLVLRRSEMSNYLATLPSWDGWKRGVVRRTLQDFRTNFHKFPRSGYDRAPECRFEQSGLNFGLHLRLGDRRAIESVTMEYFQFLEAFMETVTEVVERKGRAVPTFHVFTETLLPCPSLEDGTFDELPVWPAEQDQIHSCLNATIPTDCLEKQVGASICSPHREGVFPVRGRARPLVLHVGQDVVSTLSCMIQADGLLMGCSTFGQLAGLLNDDGISFFSVACDGLGTAVQYKMMPPLAVAERGYLWVPVEGSWRDPVLRSTGILDTALDELFKLKE